MGKNRGQRKLEYALKEFKQALNSEQHETKTLIEKNDLTLI